MTDAPAVSVVVAGVTLILEPSVATSVIVNVVLLLLLPEIVISLPMSSVLNSSLIVPLAVAEIVLPLKEIPVDAFRFCHQSL